MTAEKYERQVKFGREPRPETTVALGQAVAAHDVLGQILDAGHSEATVVVKDPGRDADGGWSVWAVGYGH